MKRLFVIQLPLIRADFVEQVDKVSKTKRVGKNID